MVNDRSELTMGCSNCGDICTCAPRPATRAAVAEEPGAFWPATDAAWQDAAWRREISRRVRAHKRKRGDDSLPLDFDHGVDAESAAEQSPLPPPPSRYQRIAMKRAQAQYEAGKVIVFPQPGPEPERLADPVPDPVQQALAEPMPEAPRIFEAAQEPLFTAVELDASPVAPSGLPGETEIELPLPVAPLHLQWKCTLIDFLLPISAFAMFAALVVYATDLGVGGKAAAAAWAAGFVFFWTTYQVLFVGYAGCTPGMRLSNLGLCSFADTMPRRNVRFVRCLAMLLSLLAVGLGYLWSFIDDDGMSWHDRISQTYVREL